jgi:uncharacterized protein (DUF433 family)
MDTIEVPLSGPMAAKLRSLPVEERERLAASLQELAEEAIKMREHPDIYFMNGPTGRRARARGGIDVWEIIEPYFLEGKDWDILRASYPDIPEAALRAALRYYEAYPEEIEERIRRNQDLSDT